MAVPKKRVSKTRKNLRHTNWKRDLIPQALKALSFGKALGLRGGAVKPTASPEGNENVLSLPQVSPPPGDFGLS